MKKLLIALDNNKIFEQIRDKEKYDIYEKDIIYKEGVLEYISKNEVDIIVTKDDLIGEMTKEIYIKQIKLLKPNVRIVLFVKKMDEKYLSFLFNNNVMDIIEENQNINVDNVVNYIDGSKEYENTNLNNNCKIEKKYNEYLNIISKKKIVVFGTSGAGKSYVSTVLANMIGKSLNMETLLIDFDFQNPAIDIYNNLNCNNNIFIDIVKAVDNYTINENTFISNVYKKGKVSYITNNMTIYDYQNNINTNHYNKIYDLAEKKYDVIISDISSNIFLDITYWSIKKSDIVMFVINPNYISIRQAIKYLDLLTNVWNIDKNNIYLIVNRQTEWSLSIGQIEGLLAGYKVIMQLEYDTNLENVINGISNISNNIVKEDAEIYKIFGINKELKNAKKVTNKRILYNLFRKESGT